MQRLKQIFEEFYNKNNFYKNLLFIDTETTGFANTDRIIEIGAIGIKFNGIDVEFHTFQTLINPGDGYENLEPKITEITKIASDDLKADGVPTEYEAYSAFLEFLSNFSTPDYCEIIAHNASFDENKLRTNMSRLGLSFMWPKFSCTKIMANIVPSRDKKLNTLAEYFGFINEQKHRALTDTETCAFIWAKMKLLQNV